VSRPFHFKQFSILQEHSPMKVGTDGVLLGAWCSKPAGNFVIELFIGKFFVCHIRCKNGIKPPGNTLNGFGSLPYGTQKECIGGQGCFPGGIKG